MRFEDLEVPERKIIPEDDADEILLRIALNRASNNASVSNTWPQRADNALSARMSSHALLGMRRLALEEAIRTGIYYEDPNAVPVLSDKMTNEDLAKIAGLADARVQSLTGVPE